MSLIAFGYADFPLIAYHLSRHAALAPFWIPALYALAMAVDAAAALALGFLFDRWGFLVLPASFFFSSFFAPAAFLMGPPLAFCGVALWGLGMGAQESIMRAATATLVDVDSRASAYGIMGLSYGVSWFLGSALMGFLLDVSVYYVVALSLCTQLLALPVFFLVQRELERSGSGS